MQEGSQKTPDHSRRSSIGKIFVILFLCFVASFLGAWVFINSGLVKLQSGTTAVETKRQLVLQEGEVFADVAKQVSPSVVSVITKPAGSGTGIIISKDGYIVTNKHVVSQASTEVEVVLSDGTTYRDVKVVGVDPLNDVAFLKIAGVNNLSPATISDKKAVIGQKVVAIGNALGQYQNTVTAGIISGLGRPVIAEDELAGGSVQLEDLYQTDAAINPGNSGGPLVNLEGDVIGINTAVAQRGQGIGFAIPIAAAKGMIKSVLNSGKVERPYLGVRFMAITPEVVRRFDLSVRNGAYVKSENGAPSVLEGSPAGRAGVKDGDIILKVNDESINEQGGLALLIGQYAVGETVRLEVLRDGKTMNLEVKLGAYRAN
ncbi:MAG TPA: trypsin-like peptidase domain-containing protein [Candidatus Saccharimonadales bacterium]